jgi:hypothetical protein
MSEYTYRITCKELEKTKKQLLDAQLETDKTKHLYIKQLLGHLVSHDSCGIIFQYM